eukprot:107608_1
MASTFCSCVLMMSALNTISKPCIATDAFAHKLLVLGQQIAEMENIWHETPHPPETFNTVNELATQVNAILNVIIDTLWADMHISILNASQPMGTCDACHIYANIQNVRVELGDNEHVWMHGLNAVKARRLYHTLLKQTQCINQSEKYIDLTMCEKALMAFKTRKIIKEYVREASNVWVSLQAKWMDWWRHGNVHGTSDIVLWNKKAKQRKSTECVINDKGHQTAEDILWNNDKCYFVCNEILKSSIKTNKFVDAILTPNRA